ncbi:MAG: DUF4160 domain-containing protein [Magnetococcales bacterium]|nr:DUF4160 domain-containing protein [Magnetococcales bacterium]
MTTVKRVGRQNVKIFSGDHNPPHVHVVGGSVSLMVLLATMKVVGVGIEEAAEALAWIAANRGVLLSEWEKIHG